MKICFLNLYSGTNNRGAESFAHELAQRFSVKHEVDFYSSAPIPLQKAKNIVVKTSAITPQETLPKSQIAKLAKRIFIDPPAISVLIFSLKLLPTLYKNCYDWLIPMNGFWEVIICKFVSIFTKSKILITGHSGPGWDERWNLFLKPDFFVATTEPTANWAKKVCPRTNIATIPYAVDIEKFAKAKPVKLDLEKPMILCPAAAVEYKRIDLVIKAVTKLPKGSLLHLGSGPERDKINDLGLKMLGKYRFMTQSVPPDKMPSYYAAADLVTLPSSPQENSPMVFLEAMAAGKAVVATDAPRPRWLLGKAGIFVDPEKAEEYAQALKTGLKLKSPKEIKKQVEKFSWTKIIGLYENLMENS